MLRLLLDARALVAMTVAAGMAVSAIMVWMAADADPGAAPLPAAAASKASIRAESPLVLSFEA